MSCGWGDWVVWRRTGEENYGPGRGASDSVHDRFGIQGELGEPNVASILGDLPRIASIGLGGGHDGEEWSLNIITLAPKRGSNNGWDCSVCRLLRVSSLEILGEAGGAPAAWSKCTPQRVREAGP